MQGKASKKKEKPLVIQIIHVHKMVRGENHHTVREQILDLAYSFF